MPAPNCSLPPVYFNHLYIVLDDKTYRAVIGSDFLRMAFPGAERRATLTAAGETWTGTYFYCQDNYLEFFGSGNGPVGGSASLGGHWLPGAQEGWAGLAFSVDKPGEAGIIRQAIEDTFQYEPFSELRQLRVKEKTVNWFYHVKLAERLGLGSFDSWLMEYHPDIFTYKEIPMPAAGALTRRAYLSPWNKTRTGLLPGPAVFSRITGVTIHMDAQRAERYAEILQLLGYTKTQAGETLTLSAHGFSLDIQPETSGPTGFRLSSLRLQMTRASVAPMTFIFAPKSRLELRTDLTAEWVFGV